MLCKTDKAKLVRVDASPLLSYCVEIVSLCIRDAKKVKDIKEMIFALDVDRP